MKEHTSITAVVSVVISLSLGNCYAQSGQPGGTSPSFNQELDAWVRDTIAGTDPDKARYVMRRTGCVLVTKRGEKGKIEFLPIADQVRKCASETNGFACKAVMSIVKDMKVAKNRYYDYCRDQ